MPRPARRQGPHEAIWPGAGPAFYPHDSKSFEICRSTCGAGDGNRTRMTSLEGFGSGDAGQPGRRSSNVASCPRVTVIAPVSPADRARSGHASVEVAYYGLTAAPWSSSSPSELRITSVSRCLATGVGTPPTLRFAGCSCWRLLVVHGPSGAPRGHAFATSAIRPTHEAVSCAGPHRRRGLGRHRPGPQPPARARSESYRHGLASQAALTTSRPESMPRERTA